MGKTINTYATENPGDVVSPAVGDRIPGDRSGSPKVLTVDQLLPGGSNNQLQFNNAGAFGGIANATWNGTTLALTAPVTLAGAVGSKALTITGATQTTSQPLLDLSQTWNDGATTFTGIKLNITNTASAASSLLADFQVGGVSKVSITNAGELRVGTTGSEVALQISLDHVQNNGFFENGNLIYTTTTSIPRFVVGSTGVGISSNVLFGFHAGTNVRTSSLDVQLARGAADTLRQIRGTNAQTFELYNTTNSDTSPVNYERGFMRWATNVLEIGTEKGGTGANRNFKFSVSGQTIIEGSQIWLNPGSTSHLYINTGFVEIRSAASTLRPQLTKTVDLGTSSLGYKQLFFERQTDDGSYIDFKATADADTTSSISTLTTSGATTHHVQISINGTKAWIAVSTNPPS